MELQNKKIVKDDINFLEYSNWIIDRKNNSTTFTIKKDHGSYVIISPLGLPKHFDKIVLYAVLYILDKSNELNELILVTTRHEIAKNVFSYAKDFGKNRYARIMQALHKWGSVYIKFEGIFYQEDEYTERGFHIIDEVVLKKNSGVLTIKFNESYIKQLKETTYYKLIDFEIYKRLQKTSSARLYEILVKTFLDRNEWAINLQSLAEKMTFEKRKDAQHYYPSDVLRYLKPGISEINKKTDLEIKFDYNKETGICIFKKIEKKKESFVPAIKATESKSKKQNQSKQISDCLNYFKSLPEDQQQEIFTAIGKEPFLKFLPKDTRIYAYMTKTNKWNPES